MEGQGPRAGHVTPLRAMPPATAHGGALDMSLEDLLTWADKFVDMLHDASSARVCHQDAAGHRGIDRPEAFVRMIGASVTRMDCKLPSWGFCPVYSGNSCTQITCPPQRGTLQRSRRPATTPSCFGLKTPFPIAAEDLGSESAR